MTTKRTKILKIRLSEDEQSELKKKTSGSLASWVRDIALDSEKKRKQVEIPEVDPHLLRQVSGIGNNLNQIARRVNTEMKRGGINGVLLITQLRVIDAHLKQLLVQESISESDTK